jgi:hypothetical protein
VNLQPLVVGSRDSYDFQTGELNLSIETKKTISVKGKEFIGCGGYAMVYRLSPRRIVKVFHWHEELEKIVRDEIRGSKIIKNALPVIEVVKVKFKGYETYGLIKKYVPHPVTRDEMRSALNEGKIRNIFDLHSDNVRKDSRGKFWIVDTQTASGLI